MTMQSGTLGEMSNYLQPDHFESEKKNMNDFLSQNPLLMLARTCQNIGLEPKSSDRTRIPFPTQCHTTAPSTVSKGNSSSAVGGLFSMSHIASVSKASAVRNQTACGHSSPSAYPAVSPSNTGDCSVKSSGDEADIHANGSSRSGAPPPSSNSLVQLARLSSSLKLPGNHRQKRSKPMDVNAPSGSSIGCGSPFNNSVTRHHQKRVRRQSFSRSPISGSKPIDYTLPPGSLFSNSSTPSTSSSVSPSSLRSTPPAHSVSPPSTKTGLDIAASSASTSLSCLEMFYAVGNALGAPSERLRELLVSVAQVLMDRTQSADTTAPSFSGTPFYSESRVPLNHSADIPAVAPAQSQPTQLDTSSTQCQYCGLVCANMNNLVQHIYSHLASLHSQAKMDTPTSTVPTASSSSLLDMAACYARFLQKPAMDPVSPLLTVPAIPPVTSAEHIPVSHPHAVPSTTSAPAALVGSSGVDPNTLFLAWLNILRPGYSEALAANSSHRPL